LALQEEARALPAGAVWQYYCESRGTPSGYSWLEQVKRYERDMLARR